MAGAAEEATVARIAAAQHGVVSTRQLREAGFGRNAIARRIDGEWLVRLHESVYQVGIFGGSFAGEMAALLACGPRSVIGRRSAVAVLGVRWPRGELVEVALPHEIKTSRAGVRCLRVAPLRADEVTVRHGLRVTTPARTLVDLAATTPPAELERLIEEMQVQGLASPAEILEGLRRGAGRPGIRKLRAVADLLDEPLFTRSEAERRLKALLRSAALPMPRTNVKRAGWEVDAVWDRQRLVVEVDGYRYHRTRAKFERDRRKDGQLLLAGYRVLRITWRQLTREPDTRDRDDRGSAGRLKLARAGVFTPSLPVSDPGKVSPAGRVFRDRRSRREARADVVDERVVVRDQALGLLAEAVEVLLARVVEVVAGLLELGLETDVAAGEQRSQLQVDGVLTAVEDDVDHRPGPFQLAPVLDLVVGQRAGVGSPCRARAGGPSVPPTVGVGDEGRVGREHAAVDQRGAVEPDRLEVRGRCGGGVRGVDHRGARVLALGAQEVDLLRASVS